VPRFGNRLTNERNPADGLPTQRRQAQRLSLDPLGTCACLSRAPSAKDQPDPSVGIVVLATRRQLFITRPKLPVGRKRL